MMLSDYNWVPVIHICHMTSFLGNCKFLFECFPEFRGRHCGSFQKGKLYLLNTRSCYFDCAKCYCIHFQDKETETR